MKITVVCAGLSGNSGDDLIAYSELAALKHYLKDITNVVNFYPIRKKLVLSQDSINVYLQNNLTNTLGDIVILGGGALIQNFRNPSALLPTLYYLSRKLIRENKKYIVYGVSITSNLNPISQYLAKKVLSNAEHVFCRDPQSTEIANKLIKNSKSLCCYDSVLDPNFREYTKYFDICLSKTGNNLANRTGSILFLPSLDTRSEHQKYEQVMHFFKTTVSLSEQMSSPLIKLGFSSVMNKLDKRFITELHDGGKKIEVVHLTQADKLVNEIYSSSLVVTGRLHPGIISYKLKAPFLLFSPTSKMENLFDEKHYWRDAAKLPDINAAKVNLESLIYEKLHPSSLIDIAKLVEQIQQRKN